MPTIEEHIAQLKETDEELASALEKLIAERDNFKSQSRRWEDQAKANMTDAEAKRALEQELKALKDQMGEANPAELAELRKSFEEAQAKLADFDKVKTELNELKKASSRAELVRQIADTENVPAHLHAYITGDSEEDIKKSAEKVKRDFKVGVVGDFGDPGSQSPKGSLAAGKQLFEEYSKQ